MIMNGSPTVLRSRGEEFDPRTGFAIVERHTGSEGGLRDLKATFESAGYRTRLENNEGVWELAIITTDPSAGSGSDTVYDEWRLKTSFEEIDFWADENLREYIIDQEISNPAVTTAAAAEAVISTYRSTCNEFLQKLYDSGGNVVTGKEGPTPIANFKPKYANGTLITEANELAFLTTVYGQLAAGMTKTRTARIILTRKRSLRTTSAHRFQVNSGQLAWETPNLISRFGIPADVQALLPPTPPTKRTPHGMRWGWALQEQDAQTQGGPSRSVEVLEFIFAPLRFTFLFNS